MRVNLNLEESLLAWLHRCAVPETQRFQALAEGEDVTGEWATEICGVAPGMETAEFAIKLPFHRPDASLVPND